MTKLQLARRELVTLGAAGVLGAAAARTPAAAADDEDDKEVGAVEDLMREHGVLRRTLIVYRETALRLRAAPAMVAASQLSAAAKLFQEFGESYHERLLEEEHVFPAIRASSDALGPLVDTLAAQHARGRDVTAYILSATGHGRISEAAAEPLADALESMARMYEAHAAREDTVVFPAWKAALEPDQLADLGEQFEEIEHRELGEDGFEAALARIAAVEQALGIGALDDFTAPPPPPASL